MTLQEYNDDLAVAQKEDKEIDDEETEDEDTWEVSTNPIFSVPDLTRVIIM